ncbi:hypothetical protein SVAN01_01750 [Stagonosporopsis vannaccii]|nr:hypothetical protein SVAN01_01750 [Stagonosporopsis vannaccii]
MKQVNKSLSDVFVRVEHLTMAHIREVLYQYQRQSPAHFELAIEVHELEDTSLHKQQTKKKQQLLVVDFLIEGDSLEGRVKFPLTLHIALPRRGLKAGSLQYKVITHTHPAQTLEQFLNSAFPIIDAPLRQGTLWRWWQYNGKKIKWAGFPTELKEHIIKYCVHQPHTFGVYSDKLTRFYQRYKNNRSIRKPGPLEIVEQLGDWFQLLYVSHQVRAITLRLCLTGGNSLAHSNGLYIKASTIGAFAAHLDRLGDYYQMVEVNSVPTTAQEEVLSKCYGCFPRIYPELHRYATLRHGVRKISLSMNFHSFIHFFKVQIGGFQQLQKSQGPAYDIFERMPNLNEIEIRLPQRPRGGWRNNPCTGEPPLFHYDRPCPRILHRLIYERAAEVLAPYRNVTLRNFIDSDENQRFLTARLQAMEAFKFTMVDLEDLYDDDGGGIELGDAEREVHLPTKVKHKDMRSGYPGIIQAGFFPPFCHCNDPCALSPALCS